MRKLYLFGAIALFVFSSCGNAHINSFYNQNRWKKGTVNFTVPGWLIWTATGVMNESAKNEETKALLKLAKKIKGAKFLVAEDGRRISKADVNQLVKDLKNDDFEDLIFIKDGETTVSMMIEEKKDKIKNLFFIIDDGGEFIMMNLRTKLKLEEVNKVIKFYQERKKKNPKIKIPDLPKIPLKRV